MLMICFGATWMLYQEQLKSHEALRLENIRRVKAGDAEVRGAVETEDEVEEGNSESEQPDIKVDVDVGLAGLHHDGTGRCLRNDAEDQFVVLCCIAGIKVILILHQNTGVSNISLTKNITPRRAVCDYIIPTALTSLSLLDPSLRKNRARRIGKRSQK